MEHIKLFGSFNASSINENKDWDKENWLLHNDGIDYGGTIKDIVNKAKNYPLVPIELNRIDVVHSYDSNERERASKADYTKFPIVAVDLGINGIGVLDGNHRVQKAHRLGNKIIKAYLVPEKDILKKFGKQKLR